MLLGRIIGNVVCTMKDPALLGQKLLIVQPLENAVEVGDAVDMAFLVGVPQVVNRF